MHIHLTIPQMSSEVLLAVADFFAEREGTVLLYSGGALETARYSFLGLFPFETVSIYGRKLSHQKGGKNLSFEIKNPWDALQEYFFSSFFKDNSSMSFGWFGYGMGAYADIDVILPYRLSYVPDAYWQRPALTLSVDMLTQIATVQIDLSSLENLISEEKEWVKRLSLKTGWNHFLSTLTLKKICYSHSIMEPTFTDCPKRKRNYLKMVNQAHELICAGEIYQVNLSQRFEIESHRSPFSLFRQSCSINPASFSAYICQKDAKVVCTSPERFLCKKGKMLETRPIKGTIRRGKTAKEDRELKACLLSSEKEKAELLMITDLMRNDLGKISLAGSVDTIDIWRCETYSNVFHLLSIIRSQALAHLTPLEMIRSCFPGGSITGCPKLRAIEVIDDLERSSRGLYTGAIGYFTGSGDFDLNIAIRTLVSRNKPLELNNHVYSLQLGGGIVFDSDPRLEFQETLDKGSSIFQILQTKEILCN